MHGTDVVRPVGFALGAALCVAVASALQHQSAVGASGYRTAVHLLVRLARSPRWLIGFVASCVGLVLHGVALHDGALALVQPLLVTSLVFALPLRAMLDRDLPSWVEVTAAAVVSAALAGFLAAAAPTRGHAGADGAASAAVLGAGVLLVAACSATATRTSSGRLAGFALGFATGVLYGLVGGSLKAAVHDAGAGPLGLLSRWPLWALVITGVWALMMNQRAYTHAPLRVSLPVLTVANPVVAVVFGAYVFGEKPDDTPLRVVVQVLCLTLLAGAVTVLAARTASPRLRDRGAGSAGR